MIQSHCPHDKNCRCSCEEAKQQFPDIDWLRKARFQNLKASTIMMGWQCPKCDRAYGPSVEECKPCNRQQNAVEAQRKGLIGD
jgi:hypothetical protein